MWIFLDDSGDCGTKLQSGSSQYVVMAACIFDSREDVEHALDLVEVSRCNVTPSGEKYQLTREYKYSKSKASHKDMFFEGMKPARYRIRAIVLDKNVLWSERLLSNPGQLKNELIYHLIARNYGTISDAKLVIDGNDTRAFGISDRDHFLARVNGYSPGTLHTVEFADSARNGLVQLADMVAGALRLRAENPRSAARAHVATFTSRMSRDNHGTYWNFQ